MLLPHETQAATAAGNIGRDVELQKLQWENDWESFGESFWQGTRLGSLATMARSSNGSGTLAFNEANAGSTPVRATSCCDNNQLKCCPPGRRPGASGRAGETGVTAPLHLHRDPAMASGKFATTWEKCGLKSVKLKGKAGMPEIVDRSFHRLDDKESHPSPVGSSPTAGSFTSE